MRGDSRRQTASTAEAARSKRGAKEAHHMRALKLTFALAGLLALLRYASVYHHTSGLAVCQTT